MWMAGGGIKGGMTYGATDELGYASVENVVHEIGAGWTVAKALLGHERSMIADTFGSSGAGARAARARAKARGCGAAPRTAPG